MVRKTELSQESDVRKSEHMEQRKTISIKLCAFVVKKNSHGGSENTED